MATRVCQCLGRKPSKVSNGGLNIWDAEELSDIWVRLVDESQGFGDVSSFIDCYEPTDLCHLQF